MYFIDLTEVDSIERIKKGVLENVTHFYVFRSQFTFFDDNVKIKKLSFIVIYSLMQKFSFKNMMWCVKCENLSFLASENGAIFIDKKTRIFAFNGSHQIFERNFLHQRIDNNKRQLFYFDIVTKKCELASKNAKMSNIFLNFSSLYKLLNKAKILIHRMKYTSVK